MQKLERFTTLYEEYYECILTAYFAKCEKLANIGEVLNHLLVLEKNDINQKKGVVDGDASTEVFPVYERINKYFAEIGPMLDNELYEKISDDMVEMLDRLAVENCMNAEVLKRFYQDFLSIVYKATAKYGKTLSEMFDEEQDRDRSLGAYESLDEMKWFVKYIMAYLNGLDTSDEKQKSQIDSICQYIRSNMDVDIRRTDIAKLVHLNPNYVSRLFKNEMGMSLKEYIMSEKMKLAKELVRNTTLPISVITMKVGYSNFSYFAQVYKKVNGLSPVEDREVNGNQK